MLLLHCALVTRLIISVFSFKNPWLLVEAFTHACYMRNRITASYERLEFIGDAVLGILLFPIVLK